MRAVRVAAKAAGIDALALAVERMALPRLADGQCLVEVIASGVNQSDVKAMFGLMPHAAWPRTPGRDYAGRVVDGPVALIGKEVWGSGGELGIRRDGTHATHLVIDAAAIREKPAPLSLEEAGAIGVPFITAWHGLQVAGGVEPGDVVLVLGGNGKVGQAATQIATMFGARVFGVERSEEAYIGHASHPVEMIDASAQDLAEAARERTDGHGADIIYNTVGSPYFEAANRAMALGGRQIFISTIDPIVSFNIFEFYRGQRQYFGVDSLALDAVACGALLEAMKPGFESGTLRPFPVKPDQTYALEDAHAAYKAVLAGARERIVLRP